MILIKELEVENNIHDRSYSMEEIKDDDEI